VAWTTSIIELTHKSPSPFGRGVWGEGFTPSPRATTRRMPECTLPRETTPSRTIHGRTAPTLSGRFRYHSWISFMSHPHYRICRYSDRTNIEFCRWEDDCLTESGTVEDIFTLQIPERTYTVELYIDCIPQGEYAIQNGQLHWSTINDSFVLADCPGCDGYTAPTGTSITSSEMSTNGSKTMRVLILVILIAFIPAIMIAVAPEYYNPLTAYLLTIILTAVSALLSTKWGRKAPKKQNEADSGKCSEHGSALQKALEIDY